MIDPKLNELPVKPSPSNAQPDSGMEAKPGRGTQGLSIQDTIAGDSTLSVGARGVDTSGVRAGAGAGAGGAMVTPGTDASPAPSIVQGSRSSASGQNRIDRADTGVPGTGRTDSFQSGQNASDHPTWDEISVRAYEIWCEQGCPTGSCDSDWQQAEEELRQRRTSSSRASAASA
ncbi:MAG TPA: DUF2934 domain-containing protein [Bryobacteraceae bacterium]|jgi:hypothetical protein|nr:DUF2934 domain-containing protein [Bryobacteraceae bacterium]